MKMGGEGEGESKGRNFAEDEILLSLVILFMQPSVSCSWNVLNNTSYQNSLLDCLKPQPRC